MKYTSIAVILAFSHIALAQTGPCLAQDVFDKCLSIEDEYLKTCAQQDYACLCKWHQAKLSCYDNCPSNVGISTQKGLKDTYCSIIDAQNKTTTTSALSSVRSTIVSIGSTATSIPISPSNVSNTVNNNNSTTSSSSSSSINHHYGHGILVCLAGISTYFLI